MTLIQIVNMNERILELMKQADYPAPELALRAHKLAELIVRECVEQIIAKGTDWVDFAPSQTGVRPEYWDMAQQIKKHFGVEEQVTEPNGLHTCPYAEEIHGDYETLCDCDEERTRQCAMDV
jgi:hypothetical protein